MTKLVFEVDPPISIIFFQNLEMDFGMSGWKNIANGLNLLLAFFGAVLFLAAKLAGMLVFSDLLKSSIPHDP